MNRLLSLLYLALLLAACPASSGSGGADASAPSPTDATTLVDAANPPAGADAATIPDAHTPLRVDAGHDHDAGGASPDVSTAPEPDAATTPGPDASTEPGPDASTTSGIDAAVAALGHPFGTHGGYWATGVIFPSTHTQQQLDQATADFYDKWKASYLVAACEAGQYLVMTKPATTQYTVSEGHGYGMLLTVIMAGHDPDARTLFDGLYRFYDGHRSDVNGDLMAWAQDKTCANVAGPDSATDGDIDIAYSLLLADKQWGSGTGSIDYLAEAKRIIAAVLESDVHPQNSILVGDWASDPTDPDYDGTRPSDFALNHFKAFGRASGVTRWNDVVDKTYSNIDYLQTQYAASTGLLPDFAVKAPTATPQPAPANWLEGADDGHYSWNACRTPWRIGTDYVLSGEPRSQTAVRRMTAFIRSKTSDNPKKIRDGYDLSGNVLGTYQELAFVAPFGVAAMVEPATGTNQPWLNAVWDEVVARAKSDYYGDSVKLLSMVVMSGNWWAP